MGPQHLLFPLGLAFAFARSSVEAGRGRGSPSTTTPAPLPLPGPMDLTRPLDTDTNTSSHSARPCGGACCSMAGTHILAPASLDEHGWRVDELPLERLLPAGVLLDMAGAGHNGSLAVLTAEHLAAWEKRHGAPPPNSVLLVRFGRNHDNTPTPPVSGEAAAYLVKQGRVVGVGVDLPSLDGKARSDRTDMSPATRALLAANIYTLLSLDLSHELPVKGFSLLVLPTKLRSASSAAVRVLATARSPSPVKSVAASPRITVTARAFVAVTATFVVALSALGTGTGTRRL